MTQMTSDTELWQACQNGEHDAFRRVVERYQGLVTSITYNATGDIPISEDLAQDTFLQAWRKIRSLKEPEKLAAWLCAIARNRVRDWLRRKRTDLNRSASALPDESTTAVFEHAPDKRLEQEDETALVWRAIESIPQDYREVLVLYYREQMSTAQLAEVSGLSESGVRQRLSRARTMVRQELAAVVERGLRTTRPSHAFTLAVMAALPAMTPKVATAAVGTGAAAKSSGLLLSWSMFIGPIIGILGGLFGTWISIKNTDTPTERRFMIRYAVVIWVMVCLFMVSLALASWLLRPMVQPVTFVIIECVMVLVYAGSLIPIVIWANRGQRRIREQEGSPPLNQVMQCNPAAPGMFFGGLGGAIFGSFAWMFVMALKAEDVAWALTIAATGIGLFFIAVAYVSKRGPQARGAVTFIVTWLIAIVTAVVVNTRFHTWLAQIEGRPVADIKAQLPIWTLNMLFISVFILVLTTIYFSMVRRSRQ